MNKKFNCVDMKNRSAEKIQQILSGFTFNKELLFWKEKEKILKDRKRALSKTSDKKKP